MHISNHTYIYIASTPLPAADYRLAPKHNVYMYIHAYVESYIYIASTPSPPSTAVVLLKIIDTCIPIHISNHICIASTPPSPLPPKHNIYMYTYA